METLNFLSALPAAIVAPIGFVGFPSLATAVPFRRNLLPANIHPKPASMASASSCFFFFFVLICRDVCDGHVAKERDVVEKRATADYSLPPLQKKKISGTR